MTRQEYLFICALEECAEVQQRITKALRFGLSEVQPNQEETNEARISYEFTDLLTVMGMLYDLGIDINIPLQRSKAKIIKVEKYIKYSRSLGILDKDE